MQTVDECNAAIIWNWLQHRGGVRVWKSINLSNPGAEWMTPADKGKPTWEVSDESTLLTDAKDFVVVTMKEVKRFRVGIRRGSSGLSLKVTDGGSRRIRREVAKAGEGASYRFDYDEQSAVILVPEKTVTLVEFCAAQSADFTK
jgi:hypothetical protein